MLGKKYSHYTTSSGELLEKGAPVYKIVKDDEWNIVIKLNKKQYRKLKEKKSIMIPSSERLLLSFWYL